MEPPKEIPWKESEAKRFLYEDLLSGDVDDDMKAKEIFMMRPEYSLYPYSNFVTNLRNLRLSIRKKKESAARGESVLRNDMNIGMIDRRRPYWPDSEAHRPLVDDISSGILEAMSTRELWLSKESYQFFTYPCFSDHVRQHVRQTKERAYWSFKNGTKKP